MKNPFILVCLLGHFFNGIDMALPNAQSVNNDNVFSIKVISNMILFII